MLIFGRTGSADIRCLRITFDPPCFMHAIYTTGRFAELATNACIHLVCVSVFVYCADALWVHDPGGMLNEL